MWGVFEFLQYAWELGQRHVSMELDNLTVVRKLQQQRNGASYSSLLQYIQILLVRDWMVSFVHVVREGNRVADGLATIGRDSLLESQVFHLAPEHLLSLVHEDSASLFS
ncbi:hypothetical protein V6N11_008088 [Hibiscus sabdariffa]|uniref:RNase H type-1 domain-containing protein n=1 Tax=Hibiscus sabdariffa TaxID=183260 RepID=A0ABR2PZR7_9ROSI